MITDLFSHKIHSSGAEWPDKLVELATIFAEFDGTAYDRSAIEQRLRQYSPRSVYATRDPSKFRDEYSAYPAYFGLYYLEIADAQWRVRVTETTKRFLLVEEPDVGSFLRLQLSLFQYPSAMGAQYYSGTDRLRLQDNTAARTLQFVSEGWHLSPLRLIVAALHADANIRGVAVTAAQVSYDEVMALANHSEVVGRAQPTQRSVIDGLQRARAGHWKPPRKYESRFHLLNHTGLLVASDGQVSVRNPETSDDQAEIVKELAAIARITNQFDGFDRARSKEELEGVMASAEWGSYFDSVVTLPPDIVSALSADVAFLEAPVRPADARDVVVQYPLRPRPAQVPDPEPSDRRIELADPDVTRVKRQRRNLAHKVLLDKLDALLREKGAEPFFSQYVDLKADIPEDGSFLFEVKSGGENFFDQIRKGISQLYEYRFRYRSMLRDDTGLCLVVPERPRPDWVIDYLCRDRGISVCWFDDFGALQAPEQCRDSLLPLLQ